MIEKVLTWAAVFLCLMLATLAGYALWKSATTDFQIKGCYLKSDEFDRYRVRVLGSVPWAVDITLGYFDKYEDAEAAMARYTACNKR